MMGLVGTSAYMAPEMHLNKRPYNCFLAEIFTLGVVLFTLVSGHPPFNKADTEDVYY